MPDSTKTYSELQESRISSFLDWKRVSGSGSRPGIPGDIISEDWLGECKTHTKEGHKITFSAKVWSKIQDEASSKFKKPALFVDDGSQKLDRTWCLFPFTYTPYGLDLMLKAGFSIMELPESFVRDNINFTLKQMETACKKAVGQKDSSGIIFEVRFGGMACAVCDLDTFKELDYEWL